MRIKGQEVTCSVISSAGLEESVADVSSMDINFDRDILSEGFLGQTTEQKDDIFKGISGKIEFHMQTHEPLDLIQRINDKTKRRLPGERFQIVATLAFPNGVRRRVVIPDCSFGAIPISIGSREDFVTVTFDYAASDGRFLPA